MKRLVLQTGDVFERIGDTDYCYLVLEATPKGEWLIMLRGGNVGPFFYEIQLSLDETKWEIL